MTDSGTSVAELRDLMRQFVSDRDWDQFHSPKNLAMGLSVEAAELMEHFLWVDAEESRATALEGDRRADIIDEVADVGCYLLALANAMNFELSEAIRTKLIKNAEKYPVAVYHGKFER